MSYCKQCKVIVEVRSGRELMSKKMFEKPATYVKVWVDEMSDKTETIPDLENPVWNRTFEFALDHKPKKITLEVKDDRTLLPNVKLGNYVIDLDGINFDSTQPVKILDGEVQLVDTTQGMLDVAVIVGPQGLDNRVNNNDSNINNMNNMNNNNNNNNVNQQNLSMNDELIISLMDAQGLKKSDLLSQSDPYVKIRVGNDEQKSSTVKNNDNPIWNENFTFANVDFNNLPNIEFKVMDKDILIDDNIGIGIIDYNDIVNNFGNEINVPIQLKNKQAGFLRLKLQRNNNNNNSNIANKSLDYNMNSYDNSGNNNNYVQNIYQRTTHRLPTVHIQNEPQIVEEEIVYEKPIEIHSTIVHHEKPVIVERPIISEKHEYYRDEARLINGNETINREKYQNQDNQGFQNQSVNDQPSNPQMSNNYNDVNQSNNKYKV